MDQPAAYELTWFARFRAVMLETATVLTLIDALIDDEPTRDALFANDKAAWHQVGNAFRDFPLLSESLDATGPAPKRLEGLLACARRALDSFVAAADAYEAATRDNTVDRRALERAHRRIDQGNAALDEMHIDPAFLEAADAAAAPATTI